ncbi:hypothetical protein Tco_1479047 [Tanacetum coccineum]
MQLKELIEFCTKLQQRVLDLENTKIAQAQEITSLKKRVKKLERKKKSKTHGLKRLYKVGLSARIDSSDDEASLGDQEDASKQGTTTTAIDVERDIAKGLVIQEQEQASTPIISSKAKGKGIMEERIAREKEEANAALIVQWNDIQDKVETDYELAQRLQVEEQEELTIKEKVGDALEQETSKKQKMEDDKETVALQSMMEVISDKEEVAVDAIPLATKPPIIVDWNIIKEGKIGYYQIIRADGNSKRYSSMIQMLKSFNREDLETLWKLVKAKHGYTKLEEGYERVLWGDLKTMFEHNIEDTVWRNLLGNKVLI